MLMALRPFHEANLAEAAKFTSVLLRTKRLAEWLPGFTRRARLTPTARSSGEDTTHRTVASGKRRAYCGCARGRVGSTVFQMAMAADINGSLRFNWQYRSTCPCNSSVPGKRNMLPFPVTYRYVFVPLRNPCTQVSITGWTSFGEARYTSQEKVPAPTIANSRPRWFCARASGDVHTARHVTATVAMRPNLTRFGCQSLLTNVLPTIFPPIFAQIVSSRSGTNA